MDGAGRYDAGDMKGRKLNDHLDRIVKLKCPVLKFDSGIQSIDEISNFIIGATENNTTKKI